MRRNRIALIALPLLLLIYSSALGTSFRAEVTNDSTNSADKYFTINLYCTNNDTMPQPDPPPANYANRVTWSSPVTFSGTINIQWLDTTLNNSTPYFSDAVLLKYVTPQFNDYWDVVKAVYVESWDNSLPDKFNYSGIANSNGYPPGLGEIKVLAWHAKTTSTGGDFCIDQGDMTNDVYDWLFDDPVPSLLKTCWILNADTLKASPPPIFDPLPDDTTIGEGSTFKIRIKASDLGGTNNLVLSSSSIPANATFIDSGNGIGSFVFKPNYDQGSPVFKDYFITFYVYNSVFSDTESIKIRVSNTNRAPILTYITTPRSVAVGGTMRFYIYASDPDTENVVLQVGYEAIGGGYFDSSSQNTTFHDNLNGSGVFEFKPDASQDGLQFLAVFKATDPAGDPGVQKVKIIVTNSTDVNDINRGQLPNSFDLSQNYPNPFNSSTIIEFALPSASRVQLDIYNILGQKVKTLVDQELPAGLMSVTWDGRNETGNNVASGVYFYRMVTRDFQSSKKLLLLK